MTKLHDLGINYADPSEKNNIDSSKIVTTKQLHTFAVQICSGSAYLAKNGFVHRDIAARNVFVNSGDACKIGGFGHCRQIGNSQNCIIEKNDLLPMKWMAPEAIRDGEFSTKSDVWSFGVLMFELVTLGGSPYPELRDFEVLASLERGERMPQQESCPDEIYSIMKSCWNGDQSLRPGFTLLRQWLETLMEQAPVEHYNLRLDDEEMRFHV